MKTIPVITMVWLRADDAFVIVSTNGAPTKEMCPGLTHTDCALHLLLILQKNTI